MNNETQNGQLLGKKIQYIWQNQHQEASPSNKHLFSYQLPQNLQSNPSFLPYSNMKFTQSPFSIPVNLTSSFLPLTPIPTPHPPQQHTVTPFNYPEPTSNFTKIFPYPPPHLQTTLHLYSKKNDPLINSRNFFHPQQSILFYNSSSSFKIYKEDKPQQPSAHSQVVLERNYLTNVSPIINLEEENFPVINLEEEKQCPICFESFNSFEFYQLGICKHSFHTQCLKKIILCNVQNQSFPSKCPDEHCNREIQQKDIRKILNSEEFQLYQKFSEKEYIQSHSYLFFFCQTPDCEGKVRRQKLRTSSYYCEICTKQYCTLCLKPWHYGPCLMNEEDQHFLKFAKKKLYKTCPKCLKLVEKSSGCHHITCICKFEFCYICSKDYRTQCQCKHLSYGEHRALMAQQRKEQVQIYKQEKREKKKIQQEKKREAQEEKAMKKQLSSSKLDEESKIRKKQAVQRADIRSYELRSQVNGKTRKLFKKDFVYDE